MSRPDTLADLLKLVEMARDVELAKLTEATEILTVEEVAAQQVRDTMHSQASPKTELDIAQICSADQKWLDWCRRDLHRRNLKISNLREAVETQKSQARRAFGKALVLRQISKD